MVLTFGHRQMRLMFSVKSANFSKNEDCPSSEELLDFQNGALDTGRGSEIRSHLTRCEFCSAEVEFYAHYPQCREDENGDSDEPSKIPGPLYELAEALLKHKSDSSSLDVLLEENEEFITDNA